MSTDSIKSQLRTEMNAACPTIHLNKLLLVDIRPCSESMTSPIELRMLTVERPGIEDRFQGSWLQLTTLNLSYDLRHIIEMIEPYPSSYAYRDRRWCLWIEV